MPFTFASTPLTDVVIIEPRVFPDDRGLFLETYKRSEFTSNGIPDLFVQCNYSKSARGILRGLHYQAAPKAQGKLVWAVRGEIYDVVVDIRGASPTCGKWIAVSLSAENRKMLYVPAGFAHGFCVVSEEAEIQYMTTEEYAPELEGGVIWNDPTLGIDWPISQPLLSARDRRWPRFCAARL
jgi:dTDP-4-dehydrorhamnose 3,5-epimerase